MSVDWIPGGEAGTRGALACPPDVAQWLHDEIVQRLCSVVAALGPDPIERTDQTRCRAELEAALAALRSLLTEGVVQYHDVEFMTVVEAVQASCDAADGCCSELRLSGDAPVSPAVGRLIADFVAEALRNVVKHARPMLVTLSVAVTDDRVCVTVVNDGVRSDPGSIGAGVGLRLLTTRALRLGGAVTADAPSSDTWCTRLTLMHGPSSTSNDARSGAGPR